VTREFSAQRHFARERTRGCRFSRLGLKKGDTVILLLKRRWQFWVYAPAFMRLGVIYIPATIQLTKKDIIYRINASSAKAVITITEPVYPDLSPKRCPNVPKSCMPLFVVRTRRPKLRTAF
jgi:acetyl-CoA synthetase